MNSVIGQHRVKKMLRSAIRTGRIAHAYLFWGESGIGKDALAIAFAKTLLCEQNSDEPCNACSSCHKVDILQHPNVKLIFPLPGSDGEKNDDDESFPDDNVEEIKKQIARKAGNLYVHINIPKAKFIRIQSIREIKKEASLTSAEKGRKIFIVFDAEKMNDAAANAFLKILEEPLEGTHFLLVTSRKDAMKQTIISRCQQVQCSMLNDKEIVESLIEREHVERERATYIARLANGSYGRALQLLTDELQDYRVAVIKFLRSVLSNSPLKLFEEHEEYVSGNKRENVEQLLNMLLIWLRDAIVLRERSAAIINQDQMNDLNSFVGKFGQKNLEECLEVVERSLELLRRNVYLPLVMLSLAVQLKRMLMTNR